MYNVVLHFLCPECCVYHTLCIIQFDYKLITALDSKIYIDVSSVTPDNYVIRGQIASDPADVEKCCE